MSCSNCILTSGLEQSCDLSAPGGNKSTLYLVDRCKIDAYVDAVAYQAGIAVIDSITLSDVMDEWFMVQVYEDTLVTSETLGSINSKFINQTVTFTIAQYGDNADAEIAGMQVNAFLNDIKFSKGLVVLVQDKVGNWRVFGEVNGLRLSEMDKNTGTVATDIAGTTITLTEGEPRNARVLSAAYVSSMPIAS